MEYEFEYDDNRKIIFIRINGELLIEESSKMGLEARLKAKEINFRLIFDFKKTTFIRSIVQAHCWPDDHYIGIDPTIKHIKTAYVVNDRDMEFWSFVETSFMNKGFNIKIFQEEKDAIEWIKLH